jgi:hypothetical protein
VKKNDTTQATTYADMNYKLTKKRTTGAKHKKKENAQQKRSITTRTSNMSTILSFSYMRITGN